MKKIFFLLILIFLTCSIFSASLGQASQFGQGLSNTAQKVGFTQITLSDYAAGIVKALLGFLGIIFIALLIYGGFLYMTSAGNKEKAVMSRKTIFAAVIGLLIIISGYSITYFVTTTLESPGNITPTFNPECENTGSLNYNSCQCCNYRYLKTKQPQCCDQNCKGAGYDTGCE
jgi:hypothetical protein